MFLAVDAHYRDTNDMTIAKVVGVEFANWTDAEPARVIHSMVSPVAPYESGNFFKRELPCILALLEQVDMSQLEAIVVDGYVFTSDAHTPGLGAHLHRALDDRVAIIGVAKNAMKANSATVKAVLRGAGSRPLYVSALGMDTEIAAEHVQNMHGPHRIPTLLSLLDQETKRA